jgi:hypothetical protein
MHQSEPLFCVRDRYGWMQDTTWIMYTLVIYSSTAHFQGDQTWTDIGTGIPTYGAVEYWKQLMRSATRISNAVEWRSAMHGMFEFVNILPI